MFLIFCQNHSPPESVLIPLVFGNRGGLAQDAVAEEPKQ